MDGLWGKRKGTKQPTQTRRTRPTLAARSTSLRALCANTSETRQMNKTTTCRSAPPPAHLGGQVDVAQGLGLLQKLQHPLHLGGLKQQSGCKRVLVLVSTVPGRRVEHGGSVHPCPRCPKQASTARTLSPLPRGRSSTSSSRCSRSNFSLARLPRRVSTSFSCAWSVHGWVEWSCCQCLERRALMGT